MKVDQMKPEGSAPSTATVSPGSARLPRRRVAKGPARPTYLESAENDRMMMIITALVSEVSALRDRVDTHELLAERGIAATRAAVESFALDETDGKRREAGRHALLHRVYRIVMEDLLTPKNQKTEVPT